jgi:hypothetical protein
VKQVQLPPVSRDDQRQMLALDPSRWFAVPPDAALGVGLAPGDTIAFGVEAAWIERWVAAADAWAPVATVEPAPVSMARALGVHGVSDATVDLDAAREERGRLELEGGRLVRVRRVPVHVPAPLTSPAPSSAARAAGPDAPTTTIPDPLGPVPLAFAAAWGATRAPRDDQSAALLTPALGARFGAAARRRLFTAATAATVAVVGLLWAIGMARDRRLAWLEAEAEASRRAAAPGLAMLDSAARLDAERALVEAVTGTRTPTLDSFARLSERLPAGAMAQRVRVTGRTWQVDGNAPSAAPVLAALAAEPTFADVKLLAPSARFQDGSTARETFSIGFVVR